jgi:chromate transporter|uniref:Chromate efflux transporter n=1 Tax=Desulfobacca acetoxidans TaxID=60893 RepID=A0A7C5ERQ3_9BACT
MMPSITYIFLTFLHLGVTAFGGLAMVEPLRRRVVEKNRWLKEEDFWDGLALCQLLPGATVVQLATYVGQRLQGPLGGLAGATGFILPAFLLMVTLSWLYVRYVDLAFVKALSRGLNAVVIALLLQAFWRLGQTVKKQTTDILLALLALGLLWFKVHYLGVFLGAGAIRLLVGPAGNASGEERFIKPRASESLAFDGLLFPSIILTGCILLYLVLWRVYPILAHLTGIMFKVGLISFGGGYVMIPVLQWEVVDRLGWLTLRQFLDGILLSYVTPGPLIILSAFVGFILQGFLGAVVATLAIFLPPILIILALTPIYLHMKTAGWMRRIIQGVLDALVGMLALVTLQLGLGAVTDWKTLGLMLGAAVALILFDLNLLWVIGGAAVVSMLIF